MTTIHDPQAAEALTERIFGEGLGAFHMICVHLGLELGLFAGLADGPRNAAELAAATGLDPWYVREWLQAEYAAGLVTLDGDTIDTGRVGLAAGVSEALLQETSPFNVAGVAGAVGAVGRVSPLLLDAFRSGEGVPYAAYGPGAVSAQAAMNRPSFACSLVDEWLPAVPELHSRLADASRPARVADVGCGVGWSAIELAKAFPHLRIDGLDIDEASIAAARRNAGEAGVADRVTFEVRDITKPYRGAERYDVVTCFECLHDLAHPVAALAAARDAVAPDGFVLVMDENVAEEPPPPGSNPVEQFFATASVLWCLPQGRVEPDSATIGAVMRPRQLEELAGKAGFSGSEILPIEHPFFRFYRLAL